MVVLNLFGPLCPRQTALDTFRKSGHAFFPIELANKLKILTCRYKNVGNYVRGFSIINRLA